MVCIAVVVQSLCRVQLLQPHGLQHARLLYSSLSPKVCSDLCPLSWWCYPAISLSSIPFSFCLQSFSASFPVIQLLTSGGQIIGTSALASVLPMNIHDWFPLGLTGLISLLSKGLSRVFSKKKKEEFSPAPQFEGISSLVLSLLNGLTLTFLHNYWKIHSFDHMDLCWSMSLLFNMLSRFVIAFLPRSKCLLISWL